MIFQFHAKDCSLCHSLFQALNLTCTALHHFSVFRRDINYFGIKVCIIEPGFFKTAVTSLDPLERELHRLWNQLSPEVQASYGDKYLDKCKKTAHVIFALIMQSTNHFISGLFDMWKFTFINTFFSLCLFYLWFWFTISVVRKKQLHFESNKCKNASYFV